MWRSDLTLRDVRQIISYYVTPQKAMKVSVLLPVDVELLSS